MSHIPAERCLSIVELLAGDPGEMPLGEIAARLDLPKSGAHRLLTTLVELGWVEQDRQTGFYRLTMRLAILGQQYFAATGIPDVCQPLLDRLARETREFVRLAVIDAASLVWVADAQGAIGGLIYQPLLTTNRVPLFATASGKAWLSQLPRDEALRIILQNGGLDDAGQYGPNVVRTLDRFMQVLEETAARGYGLAVSEAEPGVTALAVAIKSGEAGPVVGTVSVAGPGVRMTEPRVKELAPTVLAAAGDLSKLWPPRLRGKNRLALATSAA